MEENTQEVAILSLEEHCALVLDQVKDEDLSESGNGLIPTSYEDGERYPAVIKNPRAWVKSPKKRGEGKKKLLIKVIVDGTPYNCKVDRGFLSNPMAEGTECEVIAKHFTPTGPDGKVAKGQVTYTWFEL